MTSQPDRAREYEPPEVQVLGSVAELTQACFKRFGLGDAFLFRGAGLVCGSGG
jgi:hypothetical protein